MKFVYNHANLNDVETLYNLVKKSNLKIPLKPIDEVKESVFLRHPLAISDYNNWKYNHETEKINYGATDFAPSMTEEGLCSVYNGRQTSEIFVDSSVAEFKEVFGSNVIPKEPKSGAIDQYSFVVDTQKRYQYPFRTTESKNFARYVSVSTFK